jgi:hypothetical protein
MGSKGLVWHFGNTLILFAPSWGKGRLKFDPKANVPDPFR